MSRAGGTLSCTAGQENQRLCGGDTFLRRWLFNLAATVSALLLLVTAALWARGRYTWVDERVFVARPNGAERYNIWGLRNTPFGVTGFLTLAVPFDPAMPRYEAVRTFAADRASFNQFFAPYGARGAAGVWWVTIPDRRHYQWHGLFHVPHWTLALLTSIVPTTWLVRRWRRRQRLTAGRCLTCGYDLRATPDRCPECGAASDVAARTAA
jgi:hypothetical protein